MAKTIKVTEAGLTKLKEELENLKTVGRADIAEKMSDISVAQSVAEKAHVCKGVCERRAVNAEKICICPSVCHCICNKRCKAEQGKGQYYG